ncbi:hypothetical protein [Maridesulfovibrio ferrireducens]|uniref:hypothetical protein n=1 Tax=Maridesulfovibrio ferrireducens TaxID=246191 RepID=UPI001A31D8E7|nr:hypothetical protein [Maridesulfovibrio ferrireducens]MBI9110011.1 hypothetical protein [Maridesulfovibrio ferrireducens]
MIIYTDRMPKRFAGYTIGPVILIRPKYKDDAGLLAHEQKHVEQFWAAPVLHGVMYRFSKGYRLKSEVEAYQAQIECGMDINRAAKFLSGKYNLGISVDAAVDLLTV